MRLDVDLERDIAAIVERLNTRRGWSVPDDASSVGVRKQAHVPDGAHVLAPVGTAPGLVVPPGEGRQGPPVVVLPGPPGELQPMWADAVVDDLVLAAIGDAEELHQSTLRLWGPPESELAARLREFETTHGDLAAAGLEVTTCLRDGELEIVTRYPPDSGPSYRRLAEHLHAVFSDTVFSDDQGSIDEVVASLLREAGATITTAESCTAGLLAGRLADVPGSSGYLLGGFVTYANQAKVDVVGVPQHLLESVGAVSAEVAEAMAAGARARLGTTFGIGVTGVAGPGGGTAEKPVRSGARLPGH